ncbi:hypothetical protein [Varibaculum cambriense]|uniref:hypothetical protein n=1 Tax=Varibaculum cambriense TaxID=184870 RepID=UPI0029120A48|nr:hypothetical protein [Varibaculum cambriense]MDU5541742.1 hypothetical protein [Varibaculum cambriense]
MTEPLILLFVGIGVAVLIGVLVVAVMVRTRRPGGGIRNWIRESADSWQENDYRSRGESSGQRVRLDTLLAEASPGDSANPLAEVESLRSAAGQMWGEEVGAIRARRAEKETSRANGAANLPAADEVPAGQLPPTFAPARRRRLPKNEAVSVTKDPEDATSYVPVVPSGKSAISPVIPSQKAQSAADDQALESANSEQGNSEQQSSKPAKPIRRWARKFTPDPGESEIREDENDLPPEETFHVDKISWQRVHAE